MSQGQNIFTTDRKIFITEDQATNPFFTSTTTTTTIPTTPPAKSYPNLFDSTLLHKQQQQPMTTPTFPQQQQPQQQPLLPPLSQILPMTPANTTTPFMQQPLPQQQLPPHFQPTIPATTGGGVQLPSIQNMLQPPRLPVFDRRRFDPKTMYYKPIWTQKRENKFIGFWYRSLSYPFTREIAQHFLGAFRYFVTDNEAVQFVSTLHRDKAGHVSAEDLRLAFQEFIVRYPKTRNPAKYYKPHYLDGFNWLESPYFPRRYVQLYAEYHNLDLHQRHPQLTQKQQYQYYQGYRSLY